MSLSRKQFLKMASGGSLYAVLGGMGLWPKFWCAGGARLTTVQRQSLVMGSVASFTAVAASAEEGYRAIRKATSVFHRMDRLFSMYRSDSEMGRLAAGSGRAPVSLSDDALALLQRAKDFHQRTEGRFDITIEPLMRRWGFRKKNAATITPPTDRELIKLKRLIGMDKLIIEDGRARLKNQGMAIDTGGIAGGYALDKAIEVMKATDIAAGFINFSGDIHCFGEVEKGKGWPVKIYDPKTDQPLPKTIYLHNQALSTSGAYQKRRSSATGQSWGHLLLPVIERPVEPVASMTAIHPSAAVADAWSTAAYIGATPPDEVQIIEIG